MKIEFDPNKNQRNIREREIPFEDVALFNFDTAHFAIDARRDDGETRHIAIGYLKERLHVLCFVETADGIRVISFRKANAREVKRYGQSQTTHG